MSSPVRQVYEFGAFQLDVSQRVLLRDGQIVALTPKLYETLLVLVQSSGRVVSKDDLMSRVWPDTIVEERSLSQNIFLLRKALGNDTRGCHYIETVPKVGYRFLADVVELSDQCDALVVERHDRLRIVSSQEETFAGDGGDEDVAVRSAQHPNRRADLSAIAHTSFQSKARLIVSFALLALFLAVSAILLISKKAARPAPPAAVRSIAVLPFKPLSADSGDEYLGLGMADTLITRLSGVGRFAVRPTSAVRRYQGSEQDAVAAGREQKVDAVLEGSIQRSDERIRLTVRLLSVRDGSPIWSFKCDQKCGDIFAVEDSISERVAEAMTLDLTGEERRVPTKHYTEDTESYQLYLKGRFFWNKRTADGFKKALDYFNQAVERDPSYALAYAGIADCYLLLADYDWLPPEETSTKARAAAALLTRTAA